MNITKEEAQESLAGIDQVIAQTRKALGHFTGYILMLWGVIWLIGFAGVQFFPRTAGGLWLPLDVVGFAGTWFCIKKSKFQARRPGSNRIGLAWLVLFAYMILWGVLMQPLNPRQSIAFFSTVVMCAYVVMGLWLSRVLLWVGLGVTLLTLMGYYFVPYWFPLWMAITGGGALFFSGLSICKSWK